MTQELGIVALIQRGVRGHAAAPVSRRSCKCRLPSRWRMLGGRRAAPLSGPLPIGSTPVREYIDVAGAPVRPAPGEPAS